MPRTAERVALAGDVSNAGESAILEDAPYWVSVMVEGDCPILFHRWQSDAVKAKANAAKNSAAKKTDDVESYVWRDENGQLCLPGEYLRGSLIDPRNGAAKYQQDPRSPRKSALDLYRAGVLSLTQLAPIINAAGEPALSWDFVDRRRVTVQRAGITRSRPALNAGWRAEVVFLVTTPAYISPSQLRKTITDAGRPVGVGDFRPSFGRFSIVSFEVVKDS